MCLLPNCGINIDRRWIVIWKSKYGLLLNETCFYIIKVIVWSEFYVSVAFLYDFDILFLSLCVCMCVSLSLTCTHALSFFVSLCLFHSHRHTLAHTHTRAHTYAYVWLTWSNGGLIKCNSLEFRANETDITFVMENILFSSPRIRRRYMSHNYMHAEWDFQTFLVIGVTVFVFVLSFCLFVMGIPFD